MTKHDYSLTQPDNKRVLRKTLRATHRAPSVPTVCPQEVLVFPRSRHLMGVFVGGQDGPRIFRHMTRTLRGFDLDVLTCHGERLLDFQGSVFAVRLNSPLEEDAFFALKQSLTKKLANFTPPQGFKAGLSARLKLELPDDNKTVLFTFADILGDFNVNLMYFRFDRFLNLKKLAGPRKRSSDGLRGTQLLSRMELPKGLELSLLERELRAACPNGHGLLLTLLPNNDVLFDKLVPKKSPRLKAECN